MKQEGTVLRGVFLHGVDLGGPQNMLPFLKHEKSSINKRPAFTQDEDEKLRLFLMGWPFKINNSRVSQDRTLLRFYVMIMVNSGMRVGEARPLKWRDLGSYNNDHGTWVTCTVSVRQRDLHR
ncbi:MAG: hypothetical protein EKK29_22720 [Hyphomicrobiales bacterium]|nr:MAG: hypothetical protein EKK29_22720 [Hyphomicrobiales bacterium]